MARRPNLVIVRAGDASIHERWFAGGPRNFDVMVSYFGDQPGRFSQGVEYYHAQKGPRWPVHHAIFSHHMQMLGDYAHVALICDDVDADARTWNTMFHYCDWYGLDLAQPSIVGHVSWDITRPQPGLLLRYTSFVESMAPFFSRRALARVTPTFGESVSGWGLSFLWSQRLPWPEYRSAVVDAVQVNHTIPVRQGSLRPTLDALGVDPERERNEIMKRHGIQAFEIREHARLRIWHDPEG
jgi:hypothetical protein